MIMSQKSWIFFIALLLLGTIVFLAQPVSAGTQPQVMYQTPTARPDGRVIYIVQPGDTCSRIYLLTGVTIEQLRTLNKLDQNCTIAPKQEILLKVVTPVASPTVNPNVTSTPQLPTPTPFKGNGKICVLLFNDINGNAVHEDNEATLAGGAVSISDRLGGVSKTASTTDSGDPVCIEVPEGEYNISMAIPAGYNSTTLLNQVLKVQAGETAILEFGAQSSSKVGPAAAQSPQKSGESSLMLAILGGVLILGGAGLGLYILFTRGK